MQIVLYSMEIWQKWPRKFVKKKIHSIDWILVTILSRYPQKRIIIVD